MKFITGIPYPLGVLLLFCLISGCAGSMSDITVPISMERLSGTILEQSRATRIEVVDLRRGSTMRRTVFNVSLGAITLSPPEAELVKELIADALQRVSGELGPPTIYCGIRTFDIVTPATPLYWDVTTRIELILRTRGHERTVSTEAVERTWIYPAAEIIRRVTTRALRDLSVAMEKELSSLLATPP